MRGCARLWFGVTSLILAGLALAWWIVRTEPMELRASHSVPPAALPAASLGDTNARPDVGLPAQDRPVATKGALDPVGGATDLGRIFDRFIASTDPRQRQWAVRAFSACIPAFAPSANHAPSPEPLIAALPPAGRDERSAAYQDLFARCYRLLSTNGVVIESTRQTLERDGQTRSLGARAREAIVAGELDRAERLVTQALSGLDPVEVASLAGLASRVAQSRQDNDADAPLLQLASAVDAAIPLVACDLGMDCSPQSLWSLQLCAAEGLCNGDLAARSTARMGSAAPDPAAVQVQRNRLLALIRAGGTLGVKDLLSR